MHDDGQWQVQDMPTELWMEGSLKLPHPFCEKINWSRSSKWGSLLEIQYRERREIKRRTAIDGLDWRVSWGYNFSGKLLLDHEWTQQLAEWSSAEENKSSDHHWIHRYFDRKWEAFDEGRFPEEDWRVQCDQEKEKKVRKYFEWKRIKLNQKFQDRDGGENQVIGPEPINRREHDQESNGHVQQLPKQSFESRESSRFSYWRWKAKCSLKSGW